MRKPWSNPFVSDSMPPAQPQLPRPVYAASVITFACTLVTTAFGLLFGVILGPAITGILGVFDGSLAAWALGTVTIFLVLATAAVACSVQIKRGNRLARWALIALSLATAAVGVLSWNLVVPLIDAAAACAVLVLLLLPESRRWFRQA